MEQALSVKPHNLRKLVRIVGACRAEHLGGHVTKLCLSLHLHPDEKNCVC